MDFDRRWLRSGLLDSTLEVEMQQIAADNELLEQSFGSDIDFGTAGMRAVMGAGTAKMNVYTVARATQGMANCLLRQSAAHSVAIAYDSRHRSRDFAETAASVLAGNGITAYIFPELMPTPALSFAVRELGCSAGIMITASHNPAKYNGYKAYGPDGCQMVAELAERIRSEMAAVDIFDGVKSMAFDNALDAGLIRYIDEQLTQRYFGAVLATSINPQTLWGSDLSIVYTPLNGAGLRSVTEVLRMAGLEEISVVPQQREPDGAFPTCPSPNPESADALRLGIELAKRAGAQLVLATDPDCDRVGAAVQVGDGYRLITGNEMGVLLLDYICSQRLASGSMPSGAVAVKSIVTTPLADRIAEKYGVEMKSVLTGFKYIGEFITELEQAGEVERFILGFEESYGYLSGVHVRDKDAVNAALLIAEMCAHYKAQGKSLWDVLGEIYTEHGFCISAVRSIEFCGSGAMQSMASVMNALRTSPPAAAAGESVCEVWDYSTGLGSRLGEQMPIDLPKSDVLEFVLTDSSKITVRPSGTEPKIKVYYTVFAASDEQCRSKLSRLETDFGEKLGQ